MSKNLNKKAQFGPDALVGIVLVAVLGLGGIFFLNTFVNGLALHGILSILDSEIDQHCFFMLLPLVSDDYVRAGDNVTEVPHFIEMFSYFGGESNYSHVSYRFNNTINEFRNKLEEVNKYKIVNFTKITYINGYLADEDMVAILRNQSLNEANRKISQVCSMPVYSPAGKSGFAELIVTESAEENENT